MKLIYLRLITITWSCVSMPASARYTQRSKMRLQRKNAEYIRLTCSCFSCLTKKIGGRNDPKNFAAEVSGNLHFDSIGSKNNKIFNERTIARYSVKYAERYKATIIARYGSFLNEPLLSRPFVRKRGNTGQTSSYPLTNPETRS